MVPAAVEPQVAEPQVVEPPGRLGLRRLVQRQPEVEASEDALGEDVVRGMIAVETGPASGTEGVHYRHYYEPRAKKGKLYLDDPVTYSKYDKYEEYGKLWKDDYRSGYADPRYWTKKGYMTWEINDNVSAAAAIQAWLSGVTIAECATVLLAIETDTVRRALGDANFDYLYGTLPTSKGDTRLGLSARRGRVEGDVAREFLTMSPRAKAARDNPEESTLGKLGKRPLKKGDWVYITNHPKFLLKHPGSAFQGENAVYIGERKNDKAQLFSGFGMNNVTEESLLQTMVDEYDRDRDADDYRKLVQRFAKDVETLLENDGLSWKQLYVKYKGQIPEPYWEEKGVFPDKINDVKTLLEAPSYKMPKEVDSSEKQRTGGFRATSGQALDATKVKQTLLDTTKERLEARDYTALSADDALDAYLDVHGMGSDELRSNEKGTILKTIANAIRGKSFAKDTPGAIRCFDRIKALPNRFIDHPKLEPVLQDLENLLRGRRFEVRVSLTAKYTFGETIYVKMTSGANTDGVVSPTSKMRLISDWLVGAFQFPDMVDFNAAAVGDPMSVRLVRSPLVGSDTELDRTAWDPKNGAPHVVKLGDYSVSVYHKYT